MSGLWALLVPCALSAVTVGWHRTKSPALQLAHCGFCALCLVIAGAKGYWLVSLCAAVSLVATVASIRYLEHPWWRTPLLTHQRTDPWHLLLSWPSYWPISLVVCWQVYGAPWASWESVAGWAAAGLMGWWPWAVMRPKRWGRTFIEEREL